MRFLQIISLIFISFLFFDSSSAASLASSLSGKILLNVEENGEAWYVYPEDKKRYYLGRPSDAFLVMRELGLGITNYDFQKLAKSDMPEDIEGDMDLATKLSGKIVIQVEQNGEAWYIYPEDKRAYYLGRPEDAFEIMRELSLGISRENLAKIHKPGLEESIDKYSSYEHTKVEVAGISYTLDIVTIDLDNPNLEIITETANTSDCDSNCPATSLADFVIRNNGFAGINGSYFDTAASKKNYYFAPVYNTNEKKLINSDQTKYWTTGPVVAIDTDNNFYYYKDSRDFESIENFEKLTNASLQAAISNKPRLIENGLNQLIVGQVDTKQEYVKSVREALAFVKDEDGGKGKLLLVVMHNATVLDLAEALKVLEVDVALNLDGGYSLALWYNDEYMVGPGRDIPNAIVFKSTTN